MITNNDKNLASVIHFSALAKYFFPLGNLICPLILWVFTKDKDEFYDRNGKSALNFQLSMLLYSLAMGLVFLAIGLIFFMGRAEGLVFHHEEFYFFENEFHFPFGMLADIFPVWLILTALFTGVAYVIFDLYALITGGLQALKGKVYNYPLSISFIK